MKTLAILIFSILAGTGLANAQSALPEVTATAGGTSIGSSHQVGWTLGEPVVATFSSQATQLNQGFHQAEITVTEIATQSQDFELTVFPNPASERLFAQWENEHAAVEFRFSDLNGRELFRETVSATGRAEFDLTRYAAGNYILSAITTDGIVMKQFKVQVIR